VLNNHAKRTQFPRRDTGQGTRAGVRLCKTKPNLGKLGYLRDGTWEPCCAKQTQFLPRWVAGAGRLCKTNPISLASLAPEEQNVRNKPNFPPAGQAGGAVAGTNHAKQTQFPAVGQTPKSGFRKTKPILPAVPGGSGPQGHGTQDKCAKRSRFAPPRGIGGASRGPKRSSSRLGARSTLPVGTIAPNKPNSDRPASRPDPLGRTMRNKPNLAKRADGGAAGERKCAKRTQPRLRVRVPARLNVQNEPNLAPLLPATWRNGIKQSQFPDGQGATGAGRIAGAAGRAIPRNKANLPPTGREDHRQGLRP